ncbi:DUF5658 family protein [bacterium]|nr:DUF5658 family protein [bacterium]
MLSLLTRKLPLQDETTYFILVNVLDIFMTYALLRFGAIEANPIARFFLHRFGFNGMIAFKLVVTACVCVIAQLIATQSIAKAKSLLALGTLIVGAVVTYSFFLFVNNFFYSGN